MLKSDLFAAMRTGATLITPNNRLSNQLLVDFFYQNNHPVQDKPQCLPYQAFLQTEYKKACHRYAHNKHPVLLSPYQQQFLWQTILKEHTEHDNDGLLHAVQEAWSRCQAWEINPHHPAFTETPQTQLFQQGQLAFLQRLQTLEALTQEQLPSQLISFPELFRARCFIWVCFDDYTPNQRRLQQAMEAQGGQVRYFELPEQPTPAYLFPAQDTQDECLHIIQWIRHKLSTQAKRIGVVIPDLQNQAPIWQRLLQRHLATIPINLSLGEPLLNYPIVSQALQWLTLDCRTISNQQARLLLQSPYLTAAKTELVGRSQLAHDSACLQERVIPWDDFIAACNPFAPKLASCLQQVTAFPEQATILEWINQFKIRWSQLGFPGEYPLNSTLFQCFQRLTLLLDEFMQLGLIKPLLTKEHALIALSQLAKNTVFQVQTPATAVHITGLLEASGCDYDCLWVSGLTDQRLPQKPNLSPFIPIRLQRELTMPHATVERELQFAQQVLERLRNGSGEIIYSYPQWSGDSPNLPCSLISDLPPWEVAPPVNTSAHSAILLAEVENESYQIPLLPNETITGGTAILAHQAQCPFRAFAAHRLHAKTSQSTSDGPDASERGQIMHRILELLWRYLGSQQQLLSIQETVLQQQINAIIYQVIAPVAKTRSHSFPTLVQKIEHQRLQRLVNNYLAWEKQRPSFTVETVEQAFSIHLAGIDFKVRVDRLDRLASGQKWVIDYKSTLPSSKPWHEERPEAPQLLLYALLDNSINALLFIQLQAGRVTISGLSEEELPLPGVMPLKKGDSWSTRQQQWQQQLTLLAQEFHDGHCPPKPNRANTCQYCDFPNLCRIN